MLGNLIKMSTKEIDCLEVIQKVDCQLLSAKKAGELLGITKRQTNRIVKKYRHYGAAGIKIKHIKIHVKKDLKNNG